MKKEEKILYLMLVLLWANVFVFIIYLTLSERTKTINKEIVKIKRKLTQEQTEDLVKLIPENSHSTYIFNHE